MNVHASCVAFDGQGVLIRGASGSGKSSLALELMAWGARLVSDDRTEITVIDGRPVASAPLAISGMIEARGVGILAAEALPEAKLELVVDLDRVETDRLPAEHIAEIAGCHLPCLHKSESTHFAAALQQYLLCGKAPR